MWAAHSEGLAGYLARRVQTAPWSAWAASSVRGPSAASAVRDAYVSRATSVAAASLTGQSVPMWPALPVAAVVALTARARARGREAATALADLVEAAVDLNGHVLAEELGLTGDRPALTRDVGLAVTTRLRKDAQVHPVPEPARTPPLPAPSQGGGGS